MSKLLCVDLDGTLLDDNKNIGEGNLTAINNMLSRGHQFAIVTGRPLKSALMVARDNNLMREGSYIATFNGGQIYDCSKECVISEERMPMEYAQYVFRAAGEAGLHVHTYNDTHVICARESEELAFYLKNTRLEAIINVDPLSILEKPPVKIIVMSTKGREVLEPFRDNLASWSDGKLSSIFSHPTLLEYSSPAISKGNAVRMLAELCNVDMADTIACGDEENDLSMIEAAGLGVAMINATKAVKNVAGYITENNNNNNGIAEVIEKFVLI